MICFGVITWSNEERLHDTGLIPCSGGWSCVAGRLGTVFEMKIS